MLKSVKQKGMYPFKYMDSLEKFSEDKLPDKCECFSSLKYGISKNIIYMVIMFGIRLK